MWLIDLLTDFWVIDRIKKSYEQGGKPFSTKLIFIVIFLIVLIAGIATFLGTKTA